MLLYNPFFDHRFGPPRTIPEPKRRRNLFFRSESIQLPGRDPQVVGELLASESESFCRRHCSVLIITELRCSCLTLQQRKSLIRNDIKIR